MSLQSSSPAGSLSTPLNSTGTTDGHSNMVTDQLPNITELASFPCPFEDLATATGIGMAWHTIWEKHISPYLSENAIDDVHVSEALVNVGNWIRCPKKKVWIETKDGECLKATILCFSPADSTQHDLRMYLTSVSDFNDPTNQNVQQFGQISIKSIEAWGPVVGGFEVRLKDDAMVMVVGTDTAHLGMSQHGMNCEDCRKHDERINPKVEIDSSARQLPKVDYGMLAFPLPFDAIATECGYGLSWDNVPDILEYDSMMHEDELANPTIVASLEDMESWFARPEQKIWVETKEGERFEATLYGITSSEEDDVETADSGEDDWDMILANVTAYDAPPGNAVVLPRLHLSTEKIQGWGPLVGGFEVHYDHSMPDDFDPVMVVAVGTNSSVLRESCAIDHTRVEGIPSGCGTSSRELGIGTRRKDSKEVISARGCPKCGEDIDAMELN